MDYTVKAVSDLAGVSIRTLHHYDDVGLLKPDQVTASGYRLYSEKELELLQQILFFRELGFSLGEIKAIIHSPGFDRKEALQNHRELLVKRRERIERLLRTIEETLSTMERRIPMYDKDLFGGFDPSEYEEEARERWGESEAYKQSIERTKKYTRADWEAIQRESGEIMQGIVGLMDRDPSDPLVLEWIGRHHGQINDRFYTCPLEGYRGLADMYIQDERFTAYYENIKPGLARFMHEAMHAYCDQREGKR